MAVRYGGSKRLVWVAKEHNVELWIIALAFRRQRRACKKDQRVVHGSVFQAMNIMCYKT